MTWLKNNTHTNSVLDFAFPFGVLLVQMFCRCESNVKYFSTNKGIFA
jgi:hypothetical protein